MRLDYFLAHSTGMSRKVVKQWIRQGRVSVDGTHQCKANQPVLAEQRICVDGAVVELQGERYWMLHKPAGVVCSTADAEHRTVLDLLPVEARSGVHPVGRLDRDTTGLVLLTSDGGWSHAVTSPKRVCGKRYRVTCADTVSDEDLAALRAGVLLRGEEKPTLPATAQRLSDTELLLTIHEGRYHQVKRMLAARGNRVVALHREQVGEIVLDAALAAGEYRALTSQEVDSVLTLS